jgi:hypothetical protein
VHAASGRNMLSEGEGGSRRSGAARLGALSQPDGHHLSSLVAKMILVTYKSDVHPPDSVAKVLSVPDRTL